MNHFMEMLKTITNSLEEQEKSSLDSESEAGGLNPSHLVFNNRDLEDDDDGSDNSQHLWSAS